MRWPRGAPALGGAAALLGGCQPATLPPLPEVVVVVDTDLPVPLAVTRLRVDLYTAEGAWFATTDVARPDPRDWPVSFSVYSDDTTRPRRVLVRLRAYPDGHTRDYRGENPFTLGGPVDEGDPASDAPRLLADGHDVTPPSEPDPLDTVDRLLLVELRPDTKAKATVTLRGACLGTSAVLGVDPGQPVLAEAQGCTETEKTRAAVALAHAPADDGVRGPSAQGTWLADPCPPDDGGDRVCVPGGATILGATDDVSSGFVSARPVRVLGVRRFFLDRREASVARYRAALAAGFAPEYVPYPNEGPLGTSTAAALCTWSKLPMGREEYGLNCVAWSTARALCQREGGDLPTEAQWEHAATVAGHDRKVRYPWGNEAPSCDQAVYGGAATGTTLPECPGKGPLPRPLADSAGDRAPSGALGLAGGVSEWTLDAARPYTDACWGDASIVDPRCGDPDQDAPARVTRGADFSGPLTLPTTRYVLDVMHQSTYVGFRCAYPAAAP